VVEGREKEWMTLRWNQYLLPRWGENNPAHVVISPPRNLLHLISPTPNLTDDTKEQEHKVYDDWTTSTPGGKEGWWRCRLTPPLHFSPRTLCSPRHHFSRYHCMFLLTFGLENSLINSVSRRLSHQPIRRNHCVSP
jgi:hypothetical protein